MAYKQVRAFNQSRAGSKPLYCLQNTRLGFTIQPKYGNATQAWNNTEQHKNRNIPKGVDVPLYYSFTTSNGNEGHINVQLANGKLWSDGKIYANLKAYESPSGRPKYLGWGESVNDERVIKLTEEDEMITSKGQLRRLFLQFTGKEPSAADYAGYINKRTYAYTVDKLSAVRKDLPTVLADLKACQAGYIPVTDQLFKKK